VEVLGTAYRGKRKGNYASQPRWSSGSSSRFKRHSPQGETQIARKAFEKRSTQSQVQDLIRMAPIAPTLEVYLKAPNRYDFPNVDTPDPKLIFNHKTAREQAADLAMIAPLKPIEIWIRDTAHADIEGVDTPHAEAKKGKEKVSADTSTRTKTRRFKVVKKEEKERAEKLREKAKSKPERTRKKHKLPEKAEILQRAKEMFMENQALSGLPAITPEENELKESGLFEEARSDLMRGEESKVDSQVLQYIDQLKTELEPMGFSIVPLNS
jgi:hypothetical protein